MKIRIPACLLGLALASGARHGRGDTYRRARCPMPQPVAASRLPAPPPVASGVVARIRSTDPRGSELEIDGRWWLLLPGRTAMMRDGRPVDARALAVGQTVRYAPATATPGETALGILHVP